MRKLSFFKDCDKIENPKDDPANRKFYAQFDSEQPIALDKPMLFLTRTTPTPEKDNPKPQPKM